MMFLSFLIKRITDPTNCYLNFWSTLYGFRCLLHLILGSIYFWLKASIHDLLFLHDIWLYLWYLLNLLFTNRVRKIDVLSGCLIELGLRRCTWESRRALRYLICWLSRGLKLRNYQWLRHWDPEEGDTNLGTHSRLSIWGDRRRLEVVVLIKLIFSIFIIIFYFILHHVCILINIVESTLHLGSLALWYLHPLLLLGEHLLVDVRLLIVKAGII